jgi:4-hydroxybenzoate polyprenyltransferase
MIKKFISGIEDSNIGFGLWISTALCLVFIRDLIEHTINYSSFSEIDLFHLVHIPVFYLSTLLTIIILLHFFSKIEIAKVSRICLVFSGIIILPVIIDFFVYSALGEDMDYLYIFGNLRWSFINLLNFFVKIPGITYGMRAEIACISILSFLYIFIKRNKVFLSLLGGFFVFVICFFYLSIPGLLVVFCKFLSNFVPFLKMGSADLSAIFPTDQLAMAGVTIVELMIFSLIVATWFWRYDSNKFKALVRNFRLTRSLHYILLVIMGVVFNILVNSYSRDLLANFSFIIFSADLLAIFFAFQFSVVINDIYDVDCDKISNQNRPLVAGSLSYEEYFKAGVVYLVLALLFAFSVNYIAFRTTLIFIALYFIYSAPPLRLKRFFPLSAAIIAIQAILAFLLGYLFLEVPGAVMEVPVSILWLLFFVFLLSSSVKDLKDIEGDKEFRVYTLPVIIGEAGARKIVGILVCVSYIIVGVFLPGIFGFSINPAIFTVSFIFGIFNLLYIIRKEAKEHIIFSVYFVYIVFVLLYLISMTV